MEERAVHAPLVVRTTAANLVRAPYARAMQRYFSAADCKTRTCALAVDTTLCAGLACDARWMRHTYATMLANTSVEVVLFDSATIMQRWPNSAFADFGSRMSDDLHTRRELGGVHLWFTKATLRIRARASRGRWPCVREGGLAPASVSDGAQIYLSYLIHEPSIVLVWEALARAGASHPARFLWVIEDDVEYVGAKPFSTHLDELDARLGAADHAAIYEEHFTDCMPLFRPTWFQQQPVEGAANSKCGTLHKWEHVERYSGRLLSAVDRALSRGHFAHGELFSSTLCRTTEREWCGVRDLREVVDDNAFDGLRTGFKVNQSAAGTQGWAHVFRRSHTPARRAVASKVPMCRVGSPSFRGAALARASTSRLFATMEEDQRLIDGTSLPDGL